MKEVRVRGLKGEEAVSAKIGVERNTGPGQKTIPASGKAKYRVPDFDPDATIKARGTVVEVKNYTGDLRMSGQVRDLIKYAQERGVSLEIFTNATPVGELAKAVARGQVIITPIP